MILTLKLLSQKYISHMLGNVLNTPLSYRDSNSYYNIGDTRAFLAQRSKVATKLTSKVTNDTFRA